MGKGKHRSKLFWCQKTVTAVLTLVLAYYTLRLAWLANLDVVIRDVAVKRSADGGTVKVSLADFAEGSPKDEASRDSVPDDAEPGLDQITVQAGTNVRARVALERASEGRVPDWFTERLAWHILKLDRSQRWTQQAHDGAQRASTGDAYDFACRFTEPGRYVILCCIPPATTIGLDAVPTERLSRFLTGRFRQRCNALAVAVLNSGKDGGKGGRQPPDPGPAPDGDGGKDDQGKDGQPASNDGNQPAKRDFTTVQDGVETDDISGGHDDSAADTTNARSQKHAQKIPPCKGREVAKLTELKKCMEGQLPELKLFYEPDDFRELSVEQWQEVVRHYQMPLVFIPDQRFAQDYLGVPILDPVSGKLREVDRGEIHRLYGRYSRTLDPLDAAVVDALRVQAGHLIWAKSRDQFYLLGLATYLPVEACLNKKVSLQDVVQIRAWLRLRVTARGPRFWVDKLEISEAVEKE